MSGENDMSDNYKQKLFARADWIERVGAKNEDQVYFLQMRDLIETERAAPAAEKAAWKEREKVLLGTIHALWMALYVRGFEMVFTGKSAKYNQVIKEAALQNKGE